MSSFRRHDVVVCCGVHVAAIPTIASPVKPTSSRRRWPARRAAAGTARRRHCRRRRAAGAARQARPPAAPIGAAHRRGDRPLSPRRQRLYYLNGYRGLMVFDVTDVDHPEAPRPLADLRLAGRDDRAQRRRHRRRRRLVRRARRRLAVPRLDRARPRRDRSDEHQGRSARPSSAAGCATRASSATCSTPSAKTTAGSTAGPTATRRRQRHGVATGQPTQTVIVSSVSFAGGAIQAVGKQVVRRLQRHLQRHAQLDPARARRRSGTTSDRAAPSSLYLDICDPAGAIVARGTDHRRRARQRLGRRQRPLEPRLRRRQDRARHRLRRRPVRLRRLAATCSTPSTSPTPTRRVLAVDADDPVDGLERRPRASTPTACTSRPTTTTYGNGRQRRRSRSTTSTDPDGAEARRARRRSRARSGTSCPRRSSASSRSATTGQQPIVRATRCRCTISTSPIRPTPTLLGTSTFGQGWAWTPAAGTFKAFTMDDDQGSGRAAVQRLELSDRRRTTTACSSSSSRRRRRAPRRRQDQGLGRARHLRRQRAWCRSAISRSSVVDYANHDEPDGDGRADAGAQRHRRAARAAPPSRELSSDWWDNDVTDVGAARAADRQRRRDRRDAGAIPSLNVDGINARVFRNGDLAYVVTNVRASTAPCTGRTRLTAGRHGVLSARAQQIQVVDLRTAAPSLRGKMQLPGRSVGLLLVGLVRLLLVRLVRRRATRCRSAATCSRSVAGSRSTTASGDYVDANSRSSSSISRTPTRRRSRRPLITDDPTAGGATCASSATTLYTTHYEWFYHPSTRRLEPLDREVLRSIASI